MLAGSPTAPQPMGTTAPSSRTVLRRTVALMRTSARRPGTVEVRDTGGQERLVLYVAAAAMGAPPHQHTRSPMVRG